MRYQAKLIKRKDGEFEYNDELIVENVPLVSETHPSVLLTAPIYTKENIDSMWSHILDIQTAMQDVYLPIFSIHEIDDKLGDRHIIGNVVPTKTEHLEGFGQTIFGDLYIVGEFVIEDILKGLYSSWSAEISKLRDEQAVGRELDGIAFMKNTVAEYPYTPINKNTIELSEPTKEQHEKLLVVHSKLKEKEDPAMDEEKGIAGEEVTLQMVYDLLLKILESKEEDAAAIEAMAKLEDEGVAATEVMDTCSKRVARLAQKYHSKSLEMIEKLVEAKMDDKEIDSLLKDAPKETFSKSAEIVPPVVSSVDPRMANAVKQYNIAHGTKFDAEKLSPTAQEVFKKLLK